MRKEGTLLRGPPQFWTTAIFFYFIYISSWQALKTVKLMDSMRRRIKTRSWLCLYGYWAWRWIISPLRLCLAFWLADMAILMTSLGIINDLHTFSLILVQLAKDFQYSYPERHLRNLNNQTCWHWSGLICIVNAFENSKILWIHSHWNP